MYFSLISNITNSNGTNIRIKGLATCLYTVGQNTSMEYDVTEGVTLVSISDKYVEDLFSLNTPYISKISNISLMKTQDHILISTPTNTLGVQTNIPVLSDLSDRIDSKHIDSSKDKLIKVSKAGEIGFTNETGMRQESINDYENSLNHEDETEIITKLHKAISIRTSDIGRLDFKKIQMKSGPVFHNITFPYSLGGQKSDLDRYADDIARDTGVSSIVFENDSTDTPSIRAIVPRKNREVPVRKVLPDAIYGNSYLNLSLGMTTLGENFRCAISDYPHMLISGTTGSGKTTFVRSVLEQLNILGKDYVNCIIVDGKGETDYFDIIDTEVFHPKFNEVKLVASEAIEVLKFIQEVEVPTRKKLILEQAKVSGGRIDAKSLLIESVNTGTKPLIRPLIIVIDEFNEIMLRGGDQKNAFVEYITSIAQTSRSVLVHLILITQKPERAVLPGTIKANLPTRVAFRLPTATDSVTILGHGGAEKLLGAGDFYFHNNGRQDVRLQGYLPEK